MKYKLFDIYECPYPPELLAKSDSLSEIKSAFDKRIRETDDECILLILEYNEKKGRYEPLEYAM